MNDTLQHNRIVVPQRVIAGGFESKFETDAYDLNLRGLLSDDEYTDAITRINEKIKPSRSTPVDHALLFSGPLMIPLAVWGLRHSLQVKKRKKLLMESIRDFNDMHPELIMRWHRRPLSTLTIEPRSKDLPAKSKAADDDESSSGSSTRKELDETLKIEHIDGFDEFVV